MLSHEELKEKLSRYSLVTSCGCHVWLRAEAGNGYGQISIWNKKTGYANRVSCEVHKGPIPKGMMVMHTCDVPACVNPDHLEIGTQTDNMQDCKRKGRQNRPSFAGSRNGRAKFNETTAPAAYKDPRSLSEIAACYGVTETAARQLKGGKTWRHVTSNA